MLQTTVELVKEEETTVAKRAERLDALERLKRKRLYPFLTGLPEQSLSATSSSSTGSADGILDKRPAEQRYECGHFIKSEIHFREAGGFTGKRYSNGEPFISPMLPVSTAFTSVASSQSSSLGGSSIITKPRSYPTTSKPITSFVTASSSAVSPTTSGDAKHVEEVHKYFAVARGPAPAIYFSEVDARAAGFKFNCAVAVGYDHLEATAKFAQKYEFYHYTRKGF